LTYQSSVSSPPLLGEQKQSDKAEAAVKVANIMRAHALSGLVDPSLSGNANVAQPSGNLSANSFSAPPMSTTPPQQNINESLAVTTRLAQENLKALVDGLATASNSLFQSLPNSGR